MLHMSPGQGQSFEPTISWSAAAAPKSLQSCPTLCDPMDYSLPGSSAHGIFQARVLEWVAIAFSESWSSENHIFDFNSSGNQGTK